MTTDKERDARFASALSMVTGHESEQEMAALRMFAGTASSGYRPGWRFWNWLIDAEYTAVGPAPIWWFVAGAAVVGIVVMWIVIP